jgi:hypothetical protein
MKIFLFCLCAILATLAGYLAFLWWHPRRRSRFQVRLTAIFLLFSLVPTVPLLFLASALATNTADVLLVPEVETAMTKAVAALKAQCEDTGKKLAQALENSRAPETLLLWGVDYYFIWQRTGEKLQLTTALGRDEAGRRHGLVFHEERVRESWGQIGSELDAGESSTNLETPGHCRVWLPRGENEMVVLGYPLAPEVISAKAQLTQTMRVYNALT